MATKARLFATPSLCATSAFAVSLLATWAHAQSNSSVQLGDACQLTQSVQSCANLARTSAGRPASGLFAALAISASNSSRLAAAHGQTSQAAANALALANCRAIGLNDCKVGRWGQNVCLGFAVSVTTTANYTKTDSGAGQGADRATAEAQAMSECEGTGGKNCAIRATSCAADNPAYPSPLPLPAGGTPGAVEAGVAGTWELDINGPSGGRWVWQVSPNGTYELHSEAFDGTLANIGTITAKGGRYTIHAWNIIWDDSGTYTFPTQDTMVAVGKLGTGTWHKIARDDE